MFSVFKYRITNTGNRVLGKGLKYLLPYSMLHNQSILYENFQLELFSVPVVINTHQYQQLDRSPNKYIQIKLPARST